MSLQRTLKQSVSLTGIGVHSGKAATVTLSPAAANRGILIVRKDMESSLPISAHYRNVVSTQLATTLGRGKMTVSTVEHLMAALHGLGVDNALIEVDGPEVPIMDGSSLPFVQAIEKAGLQTQLKPRVIAAIRKRVELKLKEKWAVAEPGKGFEVHASIDWDHPSIGYQECKYVEGQTSGSVSFREIAQARTFGFLKDVEALKKMGLARGGSLDNAVVLDDALVLNPEGLRSPDEFVKHKLLDALGDFKLSGITMMGTFRLHRAGHDVHSQLLNEIFKNPDNYEILEDSVPARPLDMPQAAAVMARSRFAF